MSRPAQQKLYPAPKSSASRPGEQDEICPVCKSSRYLNKSIRFLVNPECYHKMCESCVDRIFSHGPARCPISGCTRTLRKHRFREQTFEDIKVEREVDIRKRIAKIFNRREDDFDTLLDYNNYLNDVEDITFNLIEGVDVPETEKRLDSYKQQNAASIAENDGLAHQDGQSYAALQAAEKEAARQRREAARREEDEERRAREEGKQDIIKRLASGQGDATEIAEEGQRVTLKKRMDKQAATERQRQLQAAADARKSANGSSGPLIKGLKTRKKAEPEVPFDAFGGLVYGKAQYYVLQDDYIWDGIQETKRDFKITAGGYDVREFTSRALCEAFSGLGVFIADEVASRAGTISGVSDAAISTVSAAEAGSGARDAKMEDPF